MVNYKPPKEKIRDYGDIGETDTRVKIIDPQLKASNWKEEDIKREFYFQKGKIIIEGNEAKSNGGQGPKTNLVFFEKGIPTKEIWYYELTPPNGKNYTRTKPIKDEDLGDAYKKWQKREVSENSWIVKVEDIVKRDYDLSAKNPNRIKTPTYRTPKKLAEEVLQAEKKIATIVEEVKNLLK